MRSSAAQAAVCLKPFRPDYSSDLAGAQRLWGAGGSADKSIDRKSWTMSAAAMPVISAARAHHGESAQAAATSGQGGGDAPLSYAGATSTMSAPLCARKGPGEGG